MIAKLTQECGSLYTQRFETMMKDIVISKELDLDFQGLKGLEDIPFEFSVKVLTNGVWSSGNSSCAIPAQLSYSIELFTEFY